PLRETPRGDMNDHNHEAVPIPAKLRDWLSHAVQAGASDLHLIVGYPPVLRLHGDLIELSEPPLAGEEAQPLIRSLCPPGTFARLGAEKNVDFSFEVPADGGVGRFRANLFYNEGHLGACLRVIPTTIPDLEWAEFPPALAERLAFLRDGLVIVTGATGSG